MRPVDPQCRATDDHQARDTDHRKAEAIAAGWWPIDFIDFIDFIHGFISLIDRAEKAGDRGTGVHQPSHVGHAVFVDARPRPADEAPRRSRSRVHMPAGEPRQVAFGERHGLEPLGEV
jgi:hypothetical protein